MLIGQTGPEAALYSSVRHTVQQLFGEDISHGLVGDQMIKGLDTLALVDRLLRLLEIRRIRLQQQLSWEIAEALALADYFEIQNGCRGETREFKLTEVEDGVFLKRLLEIERYTYAFVTNDDINTRLVRTASECGRMWHGLPHPDQEPPKGEEV